MDRLIESASALAKKDVHFAPETWPADNALWMDVMHAVLESGVRAVLFAPLSPADLQRPPSRCAVVRWLLLDCANDVLRQRLAKRR